MNELTEVKGSSLDILEEGKVYPKYIWKTGTTMFLSKTEQICADVFLDTRSYPACVRALQKEGIEKQYAQVKEFLERPHVADYLSEQLEERGISSGWTKEHWDRVMTDHITGKKRLKNGDLYAMKLIGDRHEFFEKSNINLFNQPIIVTQANGNL